MRGNILGGFQILKRDKINKKFEKNNKRIADIYENQSVSNMT